MNAAGGQLAAAGAPGEVVSLFGLQLGPANAAVAEPGSDGRMPTTLAGTQVLFDGLAAPLLYVSPDQINAVTPFALPPGKSTTVRVTSGGTPAPDFRGVVVPSQPEIFRSGAAAGVNQDGTLNSASNPAKRGSVVAIWVTGVGSVYPVPTDGQVVTAAQDYHCCEVYLFENRTVEVLYSGAAPGIVAGVVQINFRVPPDLSIGAAQPVPVRVAVFPAGPPAETSIASIFVTP